MTPSLASNDFHGSKHPNGQSKTAEATVVKQQFDSVWARAAVAAREEPKVCRLSAGGRWIRTLGPATEKLPWARHLVRGQRII